MRGILSKFKNENGQAVVELALTLPILLIIICGIIDYGWLFFNELNISNYSREATRFAVVSGSGQTMDSLTQKIVAKVNEIALPGMTDNLNVNVTFSNTQNINSGDVTVNVEYNVAALTPATSFIASDGKIKINSKVTMRME